MSDVWRNVGQTNFRTDIRPRRKIFWKHEGDDDGNDDGGADGDGDGDEDD